MLPYAESVEACVQYATTTLDGRTVATLHKLLNPVDYPLELDLRIYCTAECAALRGTKYQLKAVVVHHGSSQYDGHYTIDQMLPDGRWVERNDDRPPRQISSLIAMGQVSNWVGLQYDRKECR